jgi:hypothetical protein
VRWLSERDFWCLVRECGGGEERERGIEEREIGEREMEEGEMEERGMEMEGKVGEVKCVKDV